MSIQELAAQAEQQVADLTAEKQKVVGAIHELGKKRADLEAEIAALAGTENSLKEDLGLVEKALAHAATSPFLAEAPATSIEEEASPATKPRAKRATAKKTAAKQPAKHAEAPAEAAAEAAVEVAAEMPQGEPMAPAPIAGPPIEDAMPRANAPALQAVPAYVPEGSHRIDVSAQDATVLAGQFSAEPGQALHVVAGASLEGDIASGGPIWEAWDGNGDPAF